MRSYTQLSLHHIGKSHLQNGMVCEDYSASYSDDSMTIAVISDGHGDKNCFRSNIGAMIACEVAIRLCRQFWITTNHIDDIRNCDFDQLVSALEGEIAEVWRNRVSDDAVQKPFSQEELGGSSKQAQEMYRAGLRLEKAYGCTLILAMMTEKYWFGIQIGDGKCVAAYDDGVFIEPIPADEENCLGNRSTSLCNTSAKSLFRHYFSPKLPRAVFVVSDGVEESFDQAGLYNCFYSIDYWLKSDGYDVVCAKLKELLPQISEGGSGDDVSLSAILCEESALSQPKQTLDQVYERVAACANVLDKCAVMLANASDAMADKSKEISEIEEKISRLEAELKELHATLDNCTVVYEQMHQDFLPIQDKWRKASEQMERAEKFKSSAQIYWKKKYEELHITMLDEEASSESSGGDGVIN